MTLKFVRTPRGGHPCSDRRDGRPQGVGNRAVLVRPRNPIPHLCRIPATFRPVPGFDDAFVDEETEDEADEAKRPQQHHHPPTVGEALAGEGEGHDQADAGWIVIRRPLRGHNDTPFGRPPKGRIWCFQLLLISNVIFEHGLPDRDAGRKQKQGKGGHRENHENDTNRSEDMNSQYIKRLKLSCGWPLRFQIAGWMGVEHGGVLVTGEAMKKTLPNMTMEMRHLM
jgi:hypothetical protein